MANSLPVGDKLSVESFLSHRLTYPSYNWNFARLPVQRLSWTVGISARL